MLFKIDINAKCAQILSPNIASNTRQARHVPVARTGCRIVHSVKRNSIFLFGGLTTINETLNDLWRYDLIANRWELIEQLGKVPGPRCGHSFNLHSDKIFLFGGLREVTQETNETMRFDIATNTWEEIGRCASKSIISFDTIVTPVTSNRQVE